MGMIYNEARCSGSNIIAMGGPFGNPRIRQPRPLQESS